MGLVDLMLVGVHILHFTRVAIWVPAVVATMEVAVPVHITKIWHHRTLV